MLQKKLIILRILLCILFCTIALYGKDEFDINADFSLTTGNELEAVDFYTIQADIEMTFSLSKLFAGTLELEADRFEVNAGEISIRWLPNDYINVKLGKFTPDITYDHYMERDKRLFISKYILTDYIDFMGYRISNIGGKVYKKYDKNTMPISYVFHAAFNTSQFEPQIIAGFFYHYNKKDSYLGLIGCYVPYITHNLQLPGEIESQDHNFTADFIVSDYEENLIYGCELTIGSNLFDPIGLLHYPGEGNFTIFSGGDIHAGYKFRFTDMTWIPAIRYSILFPNTDMMECSNMEILAGNTLYYKKSMQLIFDTGLGINTFYSDEELNTQLEFLWGAKISIHY